MYTLALECLVHCNCGPGCFGRNCCKTLIVSTVRFIMKVATIRHRLQHTQIITTATLPSQSVALIPLSGKLHAMFLLYPAAGPPLSVENTITEFSYKPRAFKASTT